MSGVLVLAESHISIHTWPERDFAAIDIFMCGACDPYQSLPVLKAAFQPALDAARRAAARPDRLNRTMLLRLTARPGRRRPGRVAAHAWRATAMATDIWINETLYPDWGQRFLVKRELARVQSAFQDIVIFDSSAHGRVMVLDGVIQITEADEFVYQEMLTHVPLLAHGAAANVLIIGAGDGGVLRRVLQHRGVRRAVMVEIDGEVIRLAKQFLPAIAGDAWDDPRAEVIVGDGIDYVQARAGRLVRRDHRRFHRSDRRRRGAVHRRVLCQCARILTRARAGGEPVRRAVHAGRRAARDQRAAGEVLSACDRLCRRGADLCGRVHDAGLGGEGCRA